jgi:hypothetical protein
VPTSPPALPPPRGAAWPNPNRRNPPAALARGAGLAVWGTARLSRCSRGRLAENPAIVMSMEWRSGTRVSRLPVDQTGAPRPANALGDIGAIEVP